jgi:triosephosphate isomerase
MSRKKICAGNWKMFKAPSEAAQYFTEWPNTAMTTKCDVVVFVSPYNLPAVAEGLAQFQKITLAKNFSFGSQNHFYENSGAYTGEVSPEVVKKIGAQYALVGHSERRTHFAETDDIVAKKVKAAVAVGLIPMICVGETLAEREGGQTQNVVRRQLEVGLSLINIKEASFVVAYEPVWAIGTGQVATPEQAEDVHAYLRELLQGLSSKDRAQEISILYGGSVKPDNSEALAKKPNIDGFLVGGASLKAADLAAIVQLI